MDEVFKRLRLHLEVMGAQVHPFMPDNLGEMLHFSAGCAGGSAGKLFSSQRKPALLSSCTAANSSTFSEPGSSGFEIGECGGANRSLTGKKDPGKPRKARIVPNYGRCVTGSQDIHLQLLASGIMPAL